MDIHKIAQAIRVSKHEIIAGYSPAFLAFTMHVPLSEDYYGKIADSADVAEITYKFQPLNVHNFPTLFVEVRKRLNQGYQNSDYYNLRRPVADSFADKLWQKNYTFSSAPNSYSAKLGSNYGACKVTRLSN